MNWAHLWSEIVGWVGLHPIAAYLMIFLISLSESLALVGLLVPGTAMMIGIGALAGSGALSLSITLLAAMAGAIAGDGISYWLGRHYHQEIKTLWPFRTHPQLIFRGEEFFNRHGGKSIFLGRFVGPVRPVIPVIAGMLDMPARHFLGVNVLSAVGWSFAYLLPGALLGGSLTLVNAVSARLSLLLLLLLLLGWLTFWLSKKLFNLLSRLEPKREQRLLLLFSLLFFLAGGLFLGVLEDVLTLDPLVRADQSIYQFLQSLRTPWGNQLLVAVTELGDSVMNLFILLAVLAALLLRRLFRPAAYWLLAAIGGGALVQIFKWLVHKPRPIVIYQGVSGWGFPSGHTTMSVILFGFFAILLLREAPQRWRWFPFAVAIGSSLLIAFSRLYLGAHWLSDVLGGLSLGWAWVALLGIFYLRQENRPFRPRLLLIPLLLTLLLAGSWHIGQRHERDMARYQPRRELQIIGFQSWQDGGWQKLPAWRIDLAGEQEQPLTLQFAGDPQQLAMFLQKQGWERVTAMPAKTLLNALLPQPDVRHLPLLPQLADGQREQLLLVLNQRMQRLILRLWPSGFQLQGGTPLWLGSIETQQAVATAGLLTLPRGQKDFNRARGLLQDSLAAWFNLQRVVRFPEQDSPYNHWDGQILLVWNSAIQ
ncbi:bifunctional DedA family/phosphatase PAP2 family protein [Malonomonas rubra]|uniref:bifunctional DedA family/phosphatase PAP2 family protein n=1 Tax=Malonomonas rubra TaxID=57040 RepID=UPI0026E9C7C2|nr:bifunctional DedA family/phosphatase PAP2 family protein [Malonomonas rubra]